MADDEKNKGTLQLDEEAPSITLDEAAGEGTHEEPTEKDLPGSTPRLRAAVASGLGKMRPPTNVEKETPEIPENYGFTPGNIAKNAYEGAKGLATGTADMIGDINGTNNLMSPDRTLNPITNLSRLGHKYILDPFKQESEKAGEEVDKGHVASAVGHGLASVVPMVGPWAAGLGEQAGTGDVGGATGQVAGQVALGELAGHLPEIKSGAGAVLDKVTRGTPITDAGKLKAAVDQAQVVKKPSMTETEYSQKVTNALPELQRIAQDNKGKISTPRQAVQAINDRISQIEAPIGHHLDTLPETSDIPAHEVQSAVQSEVARELSKRPGSYTPQEIEKATKSVTDFIGDSDKSAKEIEGNRKRLNQDAEAYFNTDTAGKRSIDVSDATAVAQRAAGNALRKVLYGDGGTPGVLERMGVTATDARGLPMNLRNVRQSVGNLIDIRDHFEDAITKAEQTGDWSAFGKLHSGSSLAAGGLGALAGGALGGPFGAVLGTIAGEGAKAWGDYLRSKNPNLNVTKMFRNLENTKQLPGTFDINVRKQTPSYTQPIGPQLAAHAEPIGPELPPHWRAGANALEPEQPFAIPGGQPNRTGIWEQQIGAPPKLGFPDNQPQPEQPMAPIRGEQIGLHIPRNPEEAPLFNLPNVNEPRNVPELQKLPGSSPEGGPVGLENDSVLPTIGGGGREGILSRIGAPERRVGEKEARGASQRPFSTQEQIDSLSREIANDRDALVQHPNTGAAQRAAIEERMQQNRSHLNMLSEELAAGPSGEEQSRGIKPIASEKVREAIKGTGLEFHGTDSHGITHLHDPETNISLGVRDKDLDNATIKERLATKKAEF